MNDIFNFFSPLSFVKSGTVAYNPLINYDWSTTTAQEYKTDGVELVVNGGFDTDSDWVKDNTWTISNGVAVAKDFTGPYQRLHQAYPFKIGSTYKVVIECTRWKADYVYLRKPRDITKVDSTLRVNSTGVFTFYITVASDNDEIALANASTASDMDITSISVQKVIQEPNKRYLKDVGSTPTYNASMYFGRGAYLNGVDQSITVPINATIQTALKRVNRVVTINETSQTLTNYVISGLGVHKDYYLFTRLLTTAEKDSYTNTPELFYAMAQEDSTCVLNMPMCETDGYARNMKSYSLGNELSKDVGFDNSALWIIGDGAETLSSMVNGILHFKGSTGGSVSILNADVTTIAGEYYEYKVVISEYTSGNVAFGLNNYYVNNPLVMKAAGTYAFILKESVSFTGSVRLKRTELPYDMKISSLSVKKLSGAYPISNYTSSVRDNAKNLQYGLQTCKFVRDSLGVIQSASDYLECDGVGYANTNYKFNLIDGCSLTMILDETPTNYFFGNDNSAIVNTTLALYIKLMGTVLNTYGERNGYKVFDIVYKNNIFKLYRNGILLAFTTATAVADTYTYYLGGRNHSGVVTVSKLTHRLFKVHNKELTQEEITANYNSYVAKGLLT